MAHLAGGASYSMGERPLTESLDAFFYKGHRFGQMAIYFNVDRGHVRDDFTETEIRIIMLNFLNNRPN